MIARIQKSLKDEDKGFTLIELLVVIIIIGILAAIAVPVFLNQRQKGWDSAVKSDLKNAATAQETVLTDKGAYTTAVTGTGSLAEAGFKYSTKSNYDGGNAVLTATVNAGNAYCITGKSASGTAFAYSSALGLIEGTCATNGVATPASATPAPAGAGG